MLKKRAVRVLLPLLFSFCFVFSGFLSVNVFAYTGNSYDITNLFERVRFTVTNSRGYSSVTTLSSDIATQLYPNYHFDIKGSNGGNYSPLDVISFTVETYQDPWVIAFDPALYDYYLVSSLYSVGSFTSVPFLADDINVYSIDPSNNDYVELSCADVNFYNVGADGSLGFAVSCKIDLGDFANIGKIVYSGPSGMMLYSSVYQASILVFEKGSTDVYSDIISAINNQTNQLSSDIGQAADDVQQSIEDQYSGDPETEFSVDDVITQHNEKMGVLSFGSDVMLQFLDMFQSANVGTAELTLPGFNITVENVEYSVWPDYSFNFEQLNEWVPALMSVIRVMLPAFVWLMVLRYCINVFEKNFLSNGG